MDGESAKLATSALSGDLWTRKNHRSRKERWRQSAVGKNLQVTEVLQVTRGPMLGEESVWSWYTVTDKSDSFFSDLPRNARGCGYGHSHVESIFYYTDARLVTEIDQQHTLTGFSGWSLATWRVQFCSADCLRSSDSVNLDGEEDACSFSLSLSDAHEPLCSEDRWYRLFCDAVSSARAPIALFFSPVLAVYCDLMFTRSRER